jgi:hypothetical protein
MGNDFSFFPVFLVIKFQGGGGGDVEVIEGACEWIKLGSPNGETDVSSLKRFIVVCGTIFSRA